MSTTSTRPGTAHGRTGATAVHPLVADRWSPRAFDAAPLPDAEVVSLLEAARWAPSAMNAQPWRFLVGRTTEDGPDATHTGLLGTLAPPNRAWAHRAPVLVAALTRVVEDDGSARAVGPYELGLAVAQLTVQAESLGLHVHQIGGFDAEAVVDAFEVPVGYRPVAVLAVGRLGDAAGLPGWARAREGAARSRLGLEELAFAGRFGQAFDGLGSEDAGSAAA
ncbi:nitroreductase family protein [Longivirga aurantiaca]|uniref:Nitroreductase family protein n=1 Tax=Longivirga aurantiaca TaxID=1837743 RepID=A0ABW1SYX3_9ACTN